MATLPEGLSIAQVINSLIAEIAPDDPLQYLEKMYDSVNPAFIDFAVDKGKEKVAKLNNKKGTREVNAFFTLGQESATRARIEGFFSALLFMEDYIRSRGEQNNVTQAEMKTYTTVLRKMGFPQVVDAYIPDGRKYDVRSYEAVLSAYLLWLSNGSLANTPGSRVTRSNKEVCECLTAAALDSYPAVPFTAYYLGTIKTNEDVLTLAEKMYKDSNFDTYISKEFSQINEPKYIVTTSNAPIVNVVNHPLGVMTYGMTDANKQTVNWFSAFSASPEFAKIAAANNTTPEAISKYMITTSLEQHQRNIQLGNPIAKFINEQKICGEIYTRLRESRGLLADKKDYE